MSHPTDYCVPTVLGLRDSTRPTPRARSRRRPPASASARRARSGCPPWWTRSRTGARARQPFERNDLGGRLDPAGELGHRLDARLLAGHQAQDHHAIVGHHAQRLERARALVVVLEQEALEARTLEDPLGDRLVAAARVE